MFAFLFKTGGKIFQKYLFTKTTHFSSLYLQCALYFKFQHYYKMALTYYLTVSFNCILNPILYIHTAGLEFFFLITHGKIRERSFSHLSGNPGNIREGLGLLVASAYIYYCYYLYVISTFIFKSYGTQEVKFVS